VNPFSTTSWAWKALRGRSVTFAALLALTLLGVSVVHWLRVGLRELGFGWFAFLVVPILVISLLARMERRWIPEEEKRRKWARWLVIGAVMILVVESRLRAIFPTQPSSEKKESTTPPRAHGPAER
jgi:hypothetical protein